MKKKLLSLFVIAICLILASSTIVSAKTKNSFTKDTVITKENLKDVVKFVGLDPNGVVENSNLPSNSKIITIGDLEAAITKAKQMNSTSLIISNENLTNKNTDLNSNLITPLAVTGTQTCTRTFQNGDLLYTDWVTGTYYKENYTWGRIAYWTAAGGANPTVSSYSGGYVWSIISTRKLTNTLINGNTEQSYLSFNFDYTVREYINLAGNLIPVQDISLSGTHNYDISYIPY